MSKLTSSILFVFLFAIPAQAMRIVSLLPSNTEIIESLGRGQEIVGVTIYDPITPGRESVGDFLSPNLEKIISLKPDLIVGGQWTSNRLTGQLTRMGYHVLEIRNPKSIKEIYEDIRQIDRAIGGHHAESVIEQMRLRITRVQKTTASRRLLKAFIEIDPPNWTIGGHDFLTEAVRIAGAENIFQDVNASSSQISSEAIITRDPEVIIAVEPGHMGFAARPGWSQIKAVRLNQIVTDINPNLLSRPSPKLVDGIELLAERLERIQR